MPEAPRRAHEPERSLSLSSNQIFTFQETLGDNSGTISGRISSICKSIHFLNDFALEIPLLHLYFSPRSKSEAESGSVYCIVIFAKRC